MVNIDAIKKRWLEGNMSHWKDIAALVERIQQLEAPTPEDWKGRYDALLQDWKDLRKQKAKLLQGKED